MVITIAITVAFMVLCFATDLRERMIYAFPCMTLIALWTVLGVISTGQYMLIGIAVSVHLAIYLALKIIGIWGDGDSDVFLLYGIIFMTMMLTDKYEIGVTMYMILELIGMVFALLVSFVVALEVPSERKELKLIYMPYKYYSNDTIDFLIKPEDIQHIAG